jgi:hypothetical protein
MVWMDSALAPRVNAEQVTVQNSLGNRVIY